MTVEATVKSPAEIASEERARARKEQQAAKNAKTKKAPAAKKPAPAKKAAAKPAPTKQESAAIAKAVDKAETKDAAPKPAKETKAPKAPSLMDKVVEALRGKDGATTAKLAEITGWKNAGWNTILAKLATSRGLQISATKTALFDSKRQVNVFRIV